MNTKEVYVVIEKSHGRTNSVHIHATLQGAHARIHKYLRDFLSNEHLNSTCPDYKKQIDSALQKEYPMAALEVWKSYVAIYNPSMRLKLKITSLED